MSGNRPALRNVTEFHIPAIPAGAGDWPTLVAKLTTDVVAQASRQWLDFWFANLNRSMDMWWGALRSET